MRLSLTLSLPWLAAKLEDPLATALLENAGLHAPRLSWAANGVSLSIRHGGGRLAQRVKFKLGLAAAGGKLLLDLRDAKVSGISIGGNWIEKLLPRADLPLGWRLDRDDESITLSHPAANFLAAGVESDNIIIILEV